MSTEPPDEVRAQLDAIVDAFYAPAVADLRAAVLQWPELAPHADKLLAQFMRHHEAIRAKMHADAQRQLAVAGMAECREGSRTVQ